MKAGLLAGRAPAGFLPTDIADISGWYDASDTATITDAGSGAVSQWNDKSGNVRHLTQSTSARRPTTGASTLNGLNVINFAGDDSVVDVQTSPSGVDYWQHLHGNSQKEIWIVFKPGNVSDPNAAYTTLGTWDGSSARGVLLSWDDRASNSRNDSLTGFVIRALAGSAAVSHVTANNFISANTWHMLEWKLDPNNGTAADRSTLTVDEGSPSNTNAATNPVGSGNPSHGLCIGALTPSSSSGGLVGSVAEIVTFDAYLSSDDRTSLRTYLTGKWNI